MNIYFRRLKIALDYNSNNYSLAIQFQIVSSLCLICNSILLTFLFADRQQYLCSILNDTYFLNQLFLYNKTHVFQLHPTGLIFINNHYLYTCTSITIRIFVGNFVTEIYFYHQEVLVYVLSMGVVYPAYSPLDLSSLEKLTQENIYPAPTQVSAISSCISLAPLFDFGLVIS